MNIFHAEYKTDDAPIRLSYHDGNHYNAVVDPLVPTAGLGLGLPGLKPGLADKMQVAKAVTESDAMADQMALERALKESQDDELQRAIKESRLSVEHVSVSLSMRVGKNACLPFPCLQRSNNNFLIPFLSMPRCTTTRLLHCLIWTRLTLSWNRRPWNGLFSPIQTMNKVARGRHRGAADGGDVKGEVLPASPRMRIPVL